MWSLYVPILSKVYQKRNFVKLKSVRTLLRIACVADRKSYVVIICASSCEKFTKSEIYSKFRYSRLNLTFKGHPRSKVIQFKDHEVYWKTIYMHKTSYVFHAKFGHNMHHSEDTAHCSGGSPGRRKVMTSFWENGLNRKMGTNLTFKKTTFIVIQSYPSYDMLLMSSQRSYMPKKKQEASRPDSSAT